MTDHSIWLLEYGFIDRFPGSNLFAAQPNEGYRKMPYCFGLVRSRDRCVLIDTGFADAAICDRLTAKYGPTSWASPIDVLARAGVAAEQVDTIVLTHNHFDHAGCVGAFVNGHVYIQRREIDHYRAALERPARFSFLTRACETTLLDTLAARETSGLVTYVDGVAVVAPGLSVEPAFDTHTAGSQVAVVSNAADGRWVFAGDNVYVYENLEGLRDDSVFEPIAISTGSPTVWLDLADALLAKVDGESSRVLPFHESRVWERFPSRRFEDGLHIAEVSLAGGHASLVRET